MTTIRHPLNLPFAKTIALGLGTITLLSAMATYALPASAASSPTLPTIVLVHGAFAGSSSWNGVVARLLAKGYPVIAAANPLRGVRVDSAYLASILDSIPGPVVLVGHSYGGVIITNAATGKSNVKALVYVAGFATAEGESAGALNGRFPGSTLGPTLAPPTALSDGNKDLYILQAKFHDQFAADVPARDSALMAATQRPVVAAAFDELTGPPAWKSIPSWFIYGSSDKNIPPVLQPFMAGRASAKGIVKVIGASHVVMVSHPDQVTKLIEQAATAPQP